ncbi:glycosyltransferase involved in cell wall biosynthesis [Sinobaca qinghaiensis]|uniref:Glycosyltransferase involved in cell wall biosynthesis n=1 Tax=Sinobaca qinghaiensis TaxID=342944 RepID=A0A419V4R1_9BACL|nr:glycosyltransferase family 2 protein [Sinobaca qinghaiensis]RKD73432.1 glycosyltransferase involved in cell wall biosynthesis [Sinobaca qinghaiensis]
MSGVQSTVSFIIPAYNEVENVPLIHEELRKEFESLSYQYEIVYIDDGSSDNTLEVLQKLASSFEEVRYISFTRNFGKEAALIAGLEHAKGEAVIIIDADLQHPVSLIPDMLKGFEEGYDQVIAQRNRTGDSKVRTGLSNLYYLLMNKLVDVDLKNGIGDFRLLSRRAVDSMLELKEGNRFSKGLFSWIGYDQKIIHYENVQRQQGETKWSMSNLVNYGIDGMISFNHKPLRICLYVGLFILVLSLVYITIMFVQVFQQGVSVPGYFTTISAVLFLGGLHLFSLGVIGEYIGRIYYEAKQRPHYLVRETNTTRRKIE